MSPVSWSPRGRVVVCVVDEDLWLRSGEVGGKDSEREELHEQKFCVWFGHGFGFSSLGLWDSGAWSLGTLSPYYSLKDGGRDGSFPFCKHKTKECRDSRPKPRRERGGGERCDRGDNNTTSVTLLAIRIRMDGGGYVS